MTRVKGEEGDNFGKLLEQALSKTSVNNLESVYVSDQPNIRGTEARTFLDKGLGELNLKNGDLLFISYDTGKTDNFESAKESTLLPKKEVTTVPIARGPGPVAVSQLEVDDKLDKKDGYIKRGKSLLCRHGDRGMCEYCSPIPPWDEEYKKEKGYKHKSFHAYLDEINNGKNKNNGTSYIAPLEQANYSVNLKCPSGSHQPYPKGICSKCQPSTITLQQQKFRMVDHVEFADSTLLNKFLDPWRASGAQRIGYLYGKYEESDKVPLGIKAVVEAIYEPPQTDESDGITLLPWENEEQVDRVAAKLGLQKVGVTFTDLTDSGMGNGTVLCKRHKDSYFLSCLEVLMAARHQVKHPNITKYSDSGVFLSKFITCVVSGGLQGEIEPRSYQVSDSAEALVKADIVCGSTHPSMLYINESEGTRYVPDVYYLKINEYGLEVKTNAKPAFPVDFLLVTLLDSFPLNPSPMFTHDFIIENRDFLGEPQDLRNVYSYLNSDPGDGSKLCDFHFLTYLARLDVLHEEEFDLLLNFTKERSLEQYMSLTDSPGWRTFVTILEQSS